MVEMRLFSQPSLVDDTVVAVVHPMAVSKIKTKQMQKQKQIDAIL